MFSSNRLPLVRWKILIFLIDPHRYFSSHPHHLFAWMVARQNGHSVSVLVATIAPVHPFLYLTRNWQQALCWVLGMNKTMTIGFRDSVSGSYCLTSWFQCSTMIDIIEIGTRNYRSREKNGTNSPWEWLRRPRRWCELSCVLLGVSQDNLERHKNKFSIIVN